MGRKRTGERESHHDQKRREDTHGEEERHRRAETDTHTDSGGKRGRGQKNEKGRGLERTAEQKPETQGGNTEMGRKGRREGGCREPKTPSGAETIRTDRKVSRGEPGFCVRPAPFFPGSR